MCTKAYVLVCGPLVWAIVLLCPLQAQTTPDSQIIYSNSFEAPEDTSGWIGISSWMFVEDSAPDQGTHSLLIGGGCIQPTAWIDIPCTTGAATFRLSFWGKAGLVTPYGGSVLLGPADWLAPRSESIQIYTDSLDWTFYQVEMELHLEGIDTIRIQIEVGGYIYDDVQIDGLEIVAFPVLGAHTDRRVPAIFSLGPAYPNPFNPVTTIRYILPASQQVTLTVYDLLGREVARLVDRYLEPGNHQARWDSKGQYGRELPSGIYIARLVTPEYSKSIKLVLLK